MKIPKLNVYLLFGLPVIAIMFGVCAVTDKDVNDLDNTRIGQVTCSDFPAGTAPADCVTSESVLTNDGDGQLIERPGWAIVAGLVFAAWVVILINNLRQPDLVIETKRPPSNPPDRGAFSGLMLLQLAEPDERMMWLRSPALLIAIILIVLAIVAGITVLNRRGGK